MIVELFIPCFIDHFFPEVAHDTVKVLEHCGCTISYNENQTCCGRPAIENGYTKPSASLAHKLVKELQHDREIVSPSAYCIATMKNYYTPLFQNSPLHNEYKAIQKQVYELSEYIVNVLDKKDIGAKLRAKVWYYESCHATFDLMCTESTKILLQNIDGLELTGHQNTDCCGCGGGLPHSHPSMAQMLAVHNVGAGRSFRCSPPIVER